MLLLLLLCCSVSCSLLSFCEKDYTYVEITGLQSYRNLNRKCDKGNLAGGDYDFLASCSSEPLSCNWCNGVELNVDCLQHLNVSVKKDIHKFVDCIDNFPDAYLSKSLLLMDCVRNVIIAVSLVSVTLIASLVGLICYCKKKPKTKSD